MTENEKKDHAGFMAIHDFAQYMMEKHVELVPWDTGKQLMWTDSIKEYFATKSTPEIVHQEGYDFQQAKENKEQAK